ncbi:MAG: LUD domain-containing protein, partial [Thermoleophilia bacterium]|nr:LUD domain-containing protein [Thermoleophilia bacterium]
MDRDAFIARVAARLRHSAVPGDAPLPSPVVPPGVAARRGQPGTAPAAAAPAAGPPADLDGLVGLFAARLGEAGGEAARVSDRAQAHATIAAMAYERGWSALCCAPSLRWSAMGELWTDDPRRADFGISEAEWGIAETGSVVLRHHGDRGRGCSLLPPVVGLLLPVSRLLPHVGDVLGRLHDDAGPLPACVTFVTGPSHSGDIAGV